MCYPFPWNSPESIIMIKYPNSSQRLVTFSAHFGSYLNHAEESCSPILKSGMKMIYMLTCLLLHHCYFATVWCTLFLRCPRGWNTTCINSVYELYRPMFELWTWFLVSCFFFSAWCGSNDIIKQEECDSPLLSWHGSCVVKNQLTQIKSLYHTGNNLR